MKYKESLEPPTNTNKNYSKKEKKIRVWIAMGIVIVFLLAISSYISYSKFNVVNPVSSGIGVVRILANNASYVEIQHSPKVILAQPENSLQMFKDYINSRGYTLLPDEQMGAMHVIEKDGKKEHVLVSVNAYFSKWQWD